MLFCSIQCDSAAQRLPIQHDTGAGDFGVRRQICDDSVCVAHKALFIGLSLAVPVATVVDHQYVAVQLPVQHIGTRQPIANVCTSNTHGGAGRHGNTSNSTTITPS